MSAVRFLQIEPTTRCNFRCGFCVGRVSPQVDAPARLVEDALAAFPELEHVELQGEGEPLLHPGFFQMAAALAARGVQVSAITNGSLLTERVVERVLDADLVALRVSLESVDPARFRALRGGSLARVRAGIARLLARREARGLRRPSVGLSVTALRSTVDELPAIAAFAAELGLDGGIAVQPLNPQPSYAPAYAAWGEDEWLRPEDQARLEAHLAAPAWVAAARSRGATHFYEALYDGAPGCPWLRAGLHVDASGAVTPCCTVKAHHALLGRLGEDARDALLAGRAALAGGLARGEIPPTCAGCGIAASVASAAAR